MKTSIITLLVAFSAISVVFAQKDTLSFNSLKAPSSPVAVLLGFSPNDIKSISDKTQAEAEISNLVNQTKNFTILPKSFGFSVSPFKVGGSKSDYLKNLSFSIGYNDSSDVNLAKALPKSAQLAVGFSWSLIGKRIKRKSEDPKTDKTQKRNGESYPVYQLNAVKEDPYLKNDDLIIKLLESKMDKSPESKIDTLKKLSAKNFGETPFMFQVLVTQALKEADEVTDKRAFIRQKNAFQFFKAWSFDVSGGLVFNQITRQTDQGGAWFTASWSPWEDKIDDKKGKDDKNKEQQHSFLTMARLLRNGDKAIEKTKDKSTHYFDYGTKYTYHLQDRSRFFVEAEVLFRAIDAEFASDKLKYKMDINLGYQISRNFVLTAAFGKDFGTKTLPVSKSGNLFALLNLIGGLGERK